MKWKQKSRMFFAVSKTRHCHGPWSDSSRGGRRHRCWLGTQAPCHRQRSSRTAGRQTKEKAEKNKTNKNTSPTSASSSSWSASASASTSSTASSTSNFRHCVQTLCCVVKVVCRGFSPCQRGIQTQRKADLYIC